MKNLICFLLLSTLYVFIKCSPKGGLKFSGDVTSKGNIYTQFIKSDYLIVKNANSGSLVTDELKTSKLTSNTIITRKLISTNKDATIYVHSFIKVKGTLKYSSKQCEKIGATSFLELKSNLAPKENETVLHINNQKQFSLLNKNTFLANIINAFKELNENISNGVTDYSVEVKNTESNLHYVLELNFIINSLLLSKNSKFYLKINGNLVWFQNTSSTDQDDIVKNIFYSFNDQECNMINDYLIHHDLYSINRKFPIRFLLNKEKHIFDNKFTVTFGFENLTSLKDNLKTCFEDNLLKLNILNLLVN